MQLEVVKTLTFESALPIIESARLHNDPTTAQKKIEFLKESSFSHVGKQFVSYHFETNNRAEQLIFFEKHPRVKIPRGEKML